MKYQPEAVLYIGFRNDAEFYMRCLDEETDLNLYPRELSPLLASIINNLLMRSLLVAMAMGQVGSRIPWSFRVHS